MARPALIAAETGVCSGERFQKGGLRGRRAGRTLVPFAEFVVLHIITRSRMLLNIGGIANLTSIPAVNQAARWIRSSRSIPGQAIAFRIGFAERTIPMALAMITGV